MQLNINDTFNTELPADDETTNTRRQVLNACFSFVKPRVPSQPKLIHVSTDFAKSIGFSAEDIASDFFLKIFSGSEIYPNTNPFAMNYGGHQFGNWAGQLGDGRAINLFEILHHQNQLAFQLKGAGETPYSRTADGLAVLRSSIREHLCSEAMHYLGVPTTRSLSLVLTGDKVLRDMLYDGNAAYEQGAVVCRVAPSFIRFGNFQILAARGDLANLQKLADYSILHFFKDIKTKGTAAYLAFFEKVVSSTLEMIIHWQRVGFVHGVMNTDNMSILGLTIDYGPYGWLDDYNPDWTPNTTDEAHRRYRYGQQPNIALWNLYQLANALFPLINEAAPIEAILEKYKSDFATLYQSMMRKKVGFEKIENEDNLLLSDLENILVMHPADMTIFFRLLSKIKKEASAEIAFEKIKVCFYSAEKMDETVANKWMDWFGKYLLRLKMEAKNDAEREADMNATNPKYVLRNYMAQIAIEDAEKGNFTTIEELYTLLQNSYDEQPENEKWFAKRPDWAINKVGCSMLSCSS